MGASEENWLKGLDSEEAAPSALRAAFDVVGSRTAARRSQTIISEQDPSTDVFLVLEGVVRISLHSRTGRETVLRDMGPGRLFGEMAVLTGERRSANVIAMTDVELARMSGQRFLDVVGAEAEVGLWMSRQLAARVRNLTAKTSEMAMMPVGHRIQNELLRIAAGTGTSLDRCTLGDMPTHAALAARVGTKREVVTRELHELERDGIITRSREGFVILSLARLKKLSGRTAR